jgi:hypothetical protein
MGVPTTWFLLNLVHQFWCHVATDGTGVDKSVADLCRRSVAFCGDDLTAFWHPRVVARYHEILDLCGAKVSKGKHFVSTVGRGVFTEKAFSLHRLRHLPMLYRQGTSVMRRRDRWPSITSVLDNEPRKTKRELKS